ncbi:MAG: orotidine-5'-phosphate decarboxylase [Propionibacteriaceae bacterium]|jgi:orotidine-5'-phosphate decarboxylase|nr:orotidine-5'-phosphate decarboxylase [Propionibacteriaceae bacterium]
MRNGGPFGERLLAATAVRGNLCVGIDPDPDTLDFWRLPDSPEGISTFVGQILRACAQHCAIVKPQSAYYERHGSAGIAVLEQLCSDAHDMGLLVLLDVKRGDIGSTNDAYCDAYLKDDSSLKADAITVSPYLGVDSLSTYFDTAQDSDSGVFVVCRSSNPEGYQTQLARTPDGTHESVADRIVSCVKRENQRRWADIGSIGIVYGATVVQPLKQNIGGWILAPGVGAQGGTPDTVRHALGGGANHVIVPLSRAIARHSTSVRTLRSHIRDWNAKLSEIVRHCGDRPSRGSANG